MKKMNMLIKILLLCFLMLGFGIGAEAKTRQKAEMYYDYEIKTGENGSCYAVIKGFREEYRKDIDETLHGLIGNSWNISFPEKLGGAKVMGFAANAFQNVPLGDYSGHLQLSGDIVFVGAHCFENCGLTDVVFEKNNLTGKDFLETLVVDDGAFAHNPELWGIYFRDREIVLGNGIWEGWGIGESISITEACGYSFWERNIPEREVSFLAGDLEPDIYDGYIRYTEICVVNGYAKNQKAWEENGRVKRLLMYVEDKPYACLELEDTIYPQYFKLPTDAIKAAQGVDVHFRFVIEDVYKGTKYEDTCLTGLIVDFMGRRGH